MSKPQLELADVVRRFAGPYKEQFGHLMLPSHRRALQDIADCMTEDMGGGRYHCNDCNETFWSYHGCRNRSCPKCHGRQIADWLQSRTAEILPCNTSPVTSFESPSPMAGSFPWTKATLR